MDSITKDNARYTEEAVAFLSGKKLRNLLGGNVGDLVNRYRGVELSEAVIKEILSPGYVVSSVIVNDGEEDLRVIVGEAAFRHTLEGLVLIQDCDLGDDRVIRTGKTLDAQDLNEIVKRRPGTMVLCDTEALDAMKDNGYLADDIVVDGEIVARKDTMIDADLLKVLRDGAVKSVKIWKTVDVINIQDAMHHVLIDHYFCKPQIGRAHV